MSKRIWVVGGAVVAVGLMYLAVHHERFVGGEVGGGPFNVVDSGSGSGASASGSETKASRSLAFAAASSGGEGAAARPPLPSTANYLPAEKSLIRDGAVALPEVVRVFSTDFDGFSRRLALESAKDPDARAQTDVYRAMVEKEILARAARLKLSSFSCGLTLCVGAVRGDVVDYSRVAKAFLEDPGHGMANYVDGSVRLDPLTQEHRFVFSTDPGVSAIQAPLNFKANAPAR